MAQELEKLFQQMETKRIARESDFDRWAKKFEDAGDDQEDVVDLRTLGADDDTQKPKDIDQSFPEFVEQVNPAEADILGIKDQTPGQESFAQYLQQMEQQYGQLEDENEDVVNLATWGLDEPKTPKKQCKSEQITNPKTGRCIDASGATAKKLFKKGDLDAASSARVAVHVKKNIRKTPVKQKSPKKACKPDQIVNPLTGRCIKATGKTAKKILSTQKPKKPRAKTPIKKEIKPKKCPYFIRNPLNNKCVPVTGRTAEKIFKNNVHFNLLNNDDQDLLTLYMQLKPTQKSQRKRSKSRSKSQRKRTKSQRKRSISRSKRRKKRRSRPRPKKKRRSRSKSRRKRRSRSRSK